MMHCPDCGWAWSWDDDPTAHCPFCGSVGEPSDDASPDAKAACARASGEAMDDSHAAKL